MMMGWGEMQGVWMGGRMDGSRHVVFGFILVCYGTYPVGVESVISSSARSDVLHPPKPWMIDVFSCYLECATMSCMRIDVRFIHLLSAHSPFLCLPAVACLGFSEGVGYLLSLILICFRSGNGWNCCHGSSLTLATWETCRPQR